MKADYHIHTLCSDGVFTVEEVAQKVKENNIRSWAVSDHDTVEGVGRARRNSPPGSTFLSGVEITCAEFAAPGLDRSSISVHLLGYGFDETDQELNRLLYERGARIRQGYEQLMDELGHRGYKAEVPEIPISCGTVLQICDVVNYMKEKYAPLPDEIVRLIRGYSSRLTEKNIPVGEGIRAIHRAGGKAVWAHPFIVYHEFEKTFLRETEIKCALKYLIESGLDGLETDYLDFAEKQRGKLRELAQEHGLIRTAGSDFHGSPGRDRMGIETDAILERQDGIPHRIF